MTVIFFCWGRSDLDKISQTGAEWYVDCGDMVEIETGSKIPIWRTFWANSMACNRTATCHMAGCCHLANSISCHPGATCHIAGCCYMANSMSWSQSHAPHCRVNKFHPTAILKIVFVVFIFFLVFLMQFGLRRAAAFVSSSIHLLRKVKNWS